MHTTTEVKKAAVTGNSLTFLNVWQIKYNLPEISNPLVFNLKPFSFKHTGVFPEQATNWDWMSNLIKNAGRPIKVLNLFAYTGGATISCAAAGASVTHVDASKGMVTWAKENAVSSKLGDAPIRWIVDDCVKFVERETEEEMFTMPSSWILLHTAEVQRAKFGRLRRKYLTLSNYVQRYYQIILFSTLLIHIQQVFSHLLCHLCLVPPSHTEQAIR